MDGFEIAAPRFLRRKGLKGPVQVRLTEAGLAFQGAKGGDYVLPAERVRMLRFGVERAEKYGPFHETRLRIDGEAGVHLLRTSRPPAAMWEVLAGFARQVDAAGGGAGLELGLGDRRHLWLPGMLSLPLVFAVVVCLWPLRDEPKWQWAAVSALPLLLAWLGVLTGLRGRPRKGVGLAGFLAGMEAQRDGKRSTVL